MNLPYTLIAAAGCASLAFAPSATADEYKFEQSHIDACTLDGVAEWKATFGEPTPAEQEILDLERLGCQLLAARNIDGLVDAIVAEDGIILLDGAGIANGKEEQRALFHTFIDAGFDLAWEPARASVSDSEDMAYAIGSVRVTFPDGETQDAKYTSVWQKIDGKWLNVIEMRNGNGELGTHFFR